MVLRASLVVVWLAGFFALGSFPGRLFVSFLFEAGQQLRTISSNRSKGDCCSSNFDDDSAFILCSLQGHFSTNVAFVARIRSTSVFDFTPKWSHTLGILTSHGWLVRG
jgi:hypothetical protein